MKNHDVRGLYTWSMSPYEIDKLEKNGFSHSEMEDIDREYASWQQAIINDRKQRVDNVTDAAKCISNEK